MDLPTLIAEAVRGFMLVDLLGHRSAGSLTC
jgi:hypothetical protein